MPAETCLKLPINFLHREEVRRFVMVLVQRHIATGLEANFFAFAICLEFAGQGKRSRPLYSAPVNGVVDWSTEELGVVIAHFCGYTGSAQFLIEAAIEARFLVLELHDGIAELTCPLFAEWNPHLLPGYQSMQKKGQLASMEKKQRESDPLLARQHREVMQRQELLNLGDLGGDVTPDEIEHAIALVMQIDRAGGMAVRKTADYASWMLAACVRILREKTPKQVEAFLAFLLEARSDPTVQKGAEAVLQHSAVLLERSAY